MVKALVFKGDKKPKKRKRATVTAEDEFDDAPSSKALTITTSNPPGTVDDDDSWVGAELATDISGPVLIVLPSDEPTALSCDSYGKVFAIATENHVDRDPSTAEPHDVRQVWVASRVSGMEAFSLKGHHGRYLGCDKFGTLAASREAISPEEQFNCIPVADNVGAFALQTQRDTFVVAEDKKGAVDIRGDGDGVNFRSTVRIRMQARFKPKMKVAKEERAKEKISRKELEELAGRKLDEDEIKVLKKARREGNFHEMMLDIKVKGKHDKFA